MRVVREPSSPGDAGRQAAARVWRRCAALFLLAASIPLLSGCYFMRAVHEIGTYRATFVLEGARRNAQGDVLLETRLYRAWSRAPKGRSELGTRYVYLSGASFDVEARKHIAKYAHVSAEIQPHAYPLRPRIAVPESLRTAHGFVSWEMTPTEIDRYMEVTGLPHELDLATLQPCPFDREHYCATIEFEIDGKLYAIAVGAPFYFGEGSGKQTAWWAYPTKMVLYPPAFVLDAITTPAYLLYAVYTAETQT